MIVVVMDNKVSLVQLALRVRLEIVVTPDLLVLQVLQV